MENSTEPTKTNRKLQAEKMKHNIFITSKQLIAEKGFDNVTIDEICRTAGISKGLFYHYYRSKDDIIIEGYSECDEYFETHVRRSLTKENHIERIIEFIDFQILYAANLGIDVIIQTYKSPDSAWKRFLHFGREMPSQNPA